MNGTNPSSLIEWFKEGPLELGTFFFDKRIERHVKKPSFFGSLSNSVGE